MRWSRCRCKAAMDEMEQVVAQAAMHEIVSVAVQGRSADVGAGAVRKPIHLDDVRIRWWRWRRSRRRGGRWRRRYTVTFGKVIHRSDNEAKVVREPFESLCEGGARYRLRREVQVAACGYAEGAQCEAKDSEEVSGGESLLAVASRECVQRVRLESAFRGCS